MGHRGANAGSGRARANGSERASAWQPRSAGRGARGCGDAGQDAPRAAMRAGGRGAGRGWRKMQVRRDGGHGMQRASTRAFPSFCPSSKEKRLEFLPPNDDAADLPRLLWLSGHSQIDFCWARAPHGAPVLCAPIKQSARFDGTQTVAVLLVLSPSSLVSVSHFPLPLSASVSLGLCLLLFFPKLRVLLYGSLWCLRDLPIGGVLLLTDCRCSISSFSGMVCPVCRCPGAPCVPFLRADEVPEVFDVVVDEDCFRMMANT
ncbi:uncharacterized protein [Triticum aestivum]|uniref:uncharacterized protein n=1 Tax=Triticum aestivum TaxID=4565 RepID=UPI001D00F83E|nr:uncharacterized protein LOC123094363 [Triticum aestivum]